ncbi:MAG: hypothetical protein JWO67_3830 [Streptosporangiaceae bacterium]|nr:hypothetical protein [Streptosporangiaceae bacterium]
MIRTNPDVAAQALRDVNALLRALHAQNPNRDLYVAASWTVVACCQATRNAGLLSADAAAAYDAQHAVIANYVAARESRGA